MRRKVNGFYATVAILLVVGGTRGVAAAVPDVADAGGARPVITLPAPSGAPQSIDFSSDPLLRFANDPAPPEPLLLAIGDAVAHHPTVEAAIADQQASEAVRTQVRAALFPRIDAQLLHNRVITRDFGTRNAIVESLQPAVRTDLTATVDQLIYDFGATGNRISAANDRIKAAKAEVERAASETALRAAAAWYDVLDYETLTELSAAMIVRQADILADVRLRVRQGYGAASDIARAEAVLADTRAQSSRYTRFLEQARSRFREAFDAEPPRRLTRSLAPASSATSRDAAEALASNAPSVQVARRRAEAARHDYRAAKADGLPRLSAGINGARYDVFTASDYDLRGTFVLRQNLFAG